MIKPDRAFYHRLRTTVRVNRRSTVIDQIDRSGECFVSMIEVTQALKESSTHRFYLFGRCARQNAGRKTSLNDFKVY
jgi:hypothetical protein